MFVVLMPTIAVAVSEPSCVDVKCWNWSRLKKPSSVEVLPSMKVVVKPVISVELSDWIWV